MPGGWTLTEAELEKIAQDWSNVIQLTPLRGSTLSLDALLEFATDRFLVDRPVEHRGFRDRRSAASIASSSVQHAISELGIAREEKLVQVRYAARGTSGHHTFDVAVANGKLLFLAHGLSYEGNLTPSRGAEVELTKWGVRDMRDAIPELPIAIVALPPKDGDKEYERDVEDFERLGAPVLAGDSVDDILPQMRRHLPEDRLLAVAGGAHRRR